MCSISVQLVIFTATRAEAAPLIAALTRPCRCAGFDVKVWTGLLDSISVAIVCGGIGMCKSRAGLHAVAELISEAPVLNVGIAGALSALCAPGSWYEAAEVLHGWSAAEVVKTTVTDRLSTVRLLTVDEPVTDRDHANALHAAHSADLIDMEGFAVAEYVTSNGAECYILKMVSDTADESAIADCRSALETYSATCLERTLGVAHVIIKNHSQS
jgi:nucleoside phosphorylase